MKALFFLLPVVLLSACATDEVVTNYYDSDGKLIRSEQGKKAPSVSFQKKWLGAGTDMYVRINGTDQLLKQVFTFTPTGRSSYGSMAIPSSAVAAGSFLDYGDSEEDTQGIYATIEGSKVVIYTGYYVPGDMDNVNWRRWKSYSY